MTVNKQNKRSANNKERTFCCQSDCGHQIVADGSVSPAPPWTIIRMKSRDNYMNALEAANAGGEIKHFAKFITHEMHAWKPHVS